MEKEKTNKFQGNPVKIFPLRNSNEPNNTEKIKTKTMILNFKKNEKINAGSAKKIARKPGIKISARGINITKSESKVSDIVIQYRLAIK